MIQEHQQSCLSECEPIYANYRFLVMKQMPNECGIVEENLDFKTKAALKGKKSYIHHIVQKRQNKQYGSTLEVEIELPDCSEYQTAGNIALWPISDPQIVQEVSQYFHLDLSKVLDLKIINPAKKLKLKFVHPLTLRTLLEESLDLQFRITKSLLKKLAKFPSDDPDYFLSNSSPKTTMQFKRISEKQFCYLFKLVKKFNIKMTFQDFVELSDSMGSRLFTIASSCKVQKNVTIIASMVENGLISKYFQRNPVEIKSELGFSPFADYQKWKKVIFIGAGAGFAPFRAFLQEQELHKQKNQIQTSITLYFGCKRKQSDFIYAEQIKKWAELGVINRLYLAFSRQTQKKVYVHHLLEENKQIEEFIHDQKCGLYICGSPMLGQDTIKVIQKHLQQKGLSQEQSINFLKKVEQQGRLVKQVW